MQMESMAFEDRFSQPKDGHELVAVALEGATFWCLRCGALWLDARPGVRAKACWEAPAQAGRSHSTEVAPPCLPNESAGSATAAGDARLMLRALTHGWRCEAVLLPSHERIEAWRWSREGPLGGEAWSVAGAWEDGPVVNEAVRRELLIGARGTK
jgi:hypothetical protein